MAKTEATKQREAERKEREEAEAKAVADREGAARVVERMAKIAEEIDKSATIDGALKGLDEPVNELDLIASFVEDGDHFVATLRETYNEEQVNLFMSGLAFGILAERARRKAQEERDAG